VLETRVLDSFRTSHLYDTNPPPLPPTLYSDMLLHGLRGVLGERVVDAFRMSHLYADALPDPPASSHLSQEEVCVEWVGGCGMWCVCGRVWYVLFVAGRMSVVCLGVWCVLGVVCGMCGWCICRRVGGGCGMWYVWELHLSKRGCV